MSVKADERDLYWFLHKRFLEGQCIRDAVHDSGVNHKRVWFLLAKWADKGWYDWGVSVDTGWFSRDSPESIP